MNLKAQTLLQVDWRSRWTGGFCPLGAQNGLPIRHAEYPAHPTLRSLLSLPEANTGDPRRALSAWAEIVGTPRVLVLANPYQAAKLLLKAAQVEQGEPVALPLNVTRDLVEAVKHHGARPQFLDLDADLEPLGAPTRVAWSQIAGGALVTANGWQDFSDTLPLPGAQAEGVRLFGLHLSPEAEQAGALLVFGEDAASLYEALCAEMTAKRLPDLGRAAAQADRLTAIAARQTEQLAMVWAALEAAAALPLRPLSNVALGHGVFVRIPDEADAETFRVYVERENTPIQSLSALQPLHYASVRSEGAPKHRTSAAALSRWLLVPVGPDFSEEEIKHAVLGIVKAAEYLGVRWYCDPAYAVEYAAMMNALYGEHHDAYRPIFELR